MNYFDLFGWPLRLKVDRTEARKKYFELSRRYHPDYFVQQGEQEQQEALEASARLNQALKTFSDPDATLRYVLQLKGLLEEEEKYKLSPAFLMQMLEVNEALADAQLEGDEEKKATLLEELTTIEKEIYEPVEAIVERDPEMAVSEEELLQVKDYYFRKKYLRRLRQQFGGKS